LLTIVRRYTSIVRIRPVSASDFDQWLRMRRALWPDADAFDLRSELQGYLEPTADHAALVAEEPGGRIVGFIELSLRNIVDSCESSPVGYIEGWFVDADRRHQGVGRALVAAGEAWARGRGCTEMGSDSELDNTASQAAHRALGYQETGQVVNFRRSLD
jgi:aminoglycoside 6'-N-acetyltransferase I